MTMVITAAAMAAAGVTCVMVMVTVVIALNIGVVEQLAGNKCLNRGIRTAGNTAEQTDTGCCQGCLGTAADAAANQHIRIQGVQHTSQGTVAAAIGADHLRGYNAAIPDFVDLKKFGVAKVLENLTVVISYRNSHIKISFSF